MKLFNVCFLSLLLCSCSFFKASKKKNYNGKKILFVLTSHSQLGKTGKLTGAHAGEIAHPYLVLEDAGYEVEFVSPKGGEVPLDGLKSADKKTKQLFADSDFLKKLNTSKKPEQVQSKSYSAVYYAGGHGVMFDLPTNKDIQNITAEIYAQGGVVGAVCHGPAALINLRLKDGSFLVSGKDMAAFTNEEEDAIGLTDEMPFLLESSLKERGANHSEAKNFEPHIKVSDRLVTGQNPASAESVGQEILKLLAPSKPKTDI